MKIYLNREEQNKKQTFIRFLKENDALYDFIVEFNKGFFHIEKERKNIIHDDYSFNSFIKFYNGRRTYSYIEYAFIWDKTKLKYNFWCELSVKEEKLWIYDFK